MWSVRLGFDGGLGGEAENMSLFAPVVRQVLAQSQELPRRELDRLTALKQGAHNIDGFRVEMVGRLVEEQKLRLFEKQLAQRDAAPEAAPQKLMLLSKSVEIRQSETASRPTIRPRVK